MSESLLLSAAAGAASSFLTRAFEGPFKSLDDLWYTHFGYKTAIAKAEREAHIESYKKEIIAELKKIKPENYQKPKLNIVGPALEASKYYIEETELKKMFAKLIAAASDKTKNTFTHPAFVEIIKQMNSNDAKLFSLLPSYGPLVDYRLIHKDNPQIHTNFATEVYLSQTVPDYSNENSISINNLARLNIISFEKMMSGDGVLDYPVYYKIPLYSNAQLQCTQNPNLYSSLSLQKYYYNFTSFGKVFKSICI